MTNEAQPVSVEFICTTSNRSETAPGPRGERAGRSPEAPLPERQPEEHIFSQVQNVQNEYLKFFESFGNLAGKSSDLPESSRSLIKSEHRESFELSTKDIE